MSGPWYILQFFIIRGTYVPVAYDRSDRRSAGCDDTVIMGNVSSDSGSKFRYILFFPGCRAGIPAGLSPVKKSLQSVKVNVGSRRNAFNRHANRRGMGLPPDRESILCSYGIAHIRVLSVSGTFVCKAGS